MLRVLALLLGWLLSCAVARAQPAAFDGGAPIGSASERESPRGVTSTHLTNAAEHPPAGRPSLAARSFTLGAAPPPFHAPGRLARAAAIGGVVVAGLLLAGTVAIEVADHPRSEQVTRGLHLGVTMLAAPLVALASFRLRQGGIAEGSAALRTVGWAIYATAIALGVAQWYDALHDDRVRPSMGYFYGTLSVLSLLPQCFDTYLTARNARNARLLLFTARGFVVRF